MKRDLDLIREIVLFAETECDGINIPLVNSSKFQNPKYHSVTWAILREHIELAEEHGLLQTSHHSGGSHIHRLTWAGHDFLINARASTVWEAAKKVAGHLTFDVFLTALTRFGTETGLALLKSQFPELFNGS